MEKPKSKFLITSAIPYINGVKHLGNLAGSLLPADVHARFRRQLGDDVLFICGTDEHGTPAELGAAQAGQDPHTYCDAQHVLQADVYGALRPSFDHFGRSSSAQNHALTQHFYRRLDAAGLIDERDVRQVWSPADRRFLPDRYVLGTCPHCGFGEARGDQCDQCDALLDPVELIAPRSALSGERASKCVTAGTCSCASRRSSSVCSNGSARAAAGRLSSSRWRAVGSPRTSRTAASPAISLGVLRCRGRASKARSSTCGSMRPSPTSRPPRNGRRPIPSAGTGAVVVGRR